MKRRVWMRALSPRCLNYERLQMQLTVAAPENISPGEGHDL